MRTTKPRWRIKPGDKIRLNVSKEPYYSGYGGNPKEIITPDDVLEVVREDCAAVTYHLGNDGRVYDTFALCTVTKNGRQWQVAVFPEQYGGIVAEMEMRHADSAQR